MRHPMLSDLHDTGEDGKEGEGQLHFGGGEDYRGMYDSGVLCFSWQPTGDGRSSFCC